MYELQVKYVDIRIIFLKVSKLNKSSQNSDEYRIRENVFNFTVCKERHIIGIS
jgi:hypothetical protein